jgi:hypothetical protein
MSIQRQYYSLAHRQIDKNMKVQPQVSSAPDYDGLLPYTSSRFAGFIDMVQT